MELTFRKLGNSTGLTFPATFLREHHLAEGKTVIVETNENGDLVLRLKKTRNTYSAAELNAQCDFNAPMPDDLIEFENAPATEGEI